MKFDYHTHHNRCGHATGSIEDYVLSAIEHNLDYIGIADHSPHFYHIEDYPFKHKAMAKSQFPEYVNEVLQLQKKFSKQINVLLGIEADFFPQYIQYYKDELMKYPFDYIIGSVHRVNELSVFNEDRWNNISEMELNSTITQYYKLIEESARCGLFQIIGHMDVMKRTFPSFSATHLDQFDATLQTIANFDLSIEVNTAGGQYKDVGWYPSPEILERVHFYNIIPTFGSDAHTPNRVGDSFEQVKQLLKEIGFKKMAYFIQKERYIYEI